MHSTQWRGAWALAVLLSALVVASPSRPLIAQAGATGGKVAITTTSEPARQLYLQGRDLAEKLRATDARRYFEQALAADPGFALAYVGLANTSGTNKEFVDAVGRASALQARVSDGERHIIQALDAGLKGDPAGTLAHYTELVQRFPNDERAQTLLGNTLFARQDYQSAIDHYVKATSIDPAFTQPYNQLGYAYRFLEKFADAESAFKKYTELIPADPNPYDSYAELLMKVGRFDESIAMYKKALAIDPNFVASYVGIGNDQLYLGHPDQARATFATLTSVARNTGERRQARLWAAASYVHEGATDKAIAELAAGMALAEAEHDLGSMSGDRTQMGDVLREAGRYDEALASYAQAVALIDKAQVPDAVKAATRRNHLFEQGRVAAARNDLVTARARLGEYTTQVAVKQVRFEVQQQHELNGRIALAGKRGAEAAKELAAANQQDPCVLYLTYVALRQAGDTQRAATMLAKAAKFNGLSFNYAYIKEKVGKTGGTSQP